MGLASREWSSTLSPLVVLALLAHSLLFCWGEYSEEQRVRAVKDHRRKSPPGVVVDKDEEDGGW